jgi:hypothetical protein
MTKFNFFRKLLFLLIIGLITTWLQSASSSEIFFSNLRNVCQKNRKKCLQIFLKRLESEAATRQSNIKLVNNLLNFYAEFFLNKGDFENLNKVIELNQKYTESLLKSSSEVDLDSVDFFVRFIFHFSDPKKFNDWANQLCTELRKDAQKEAFIKYILSQVFENNSEDKLVKRLLQDPAWRKSFDDSSAKMIWQRTRFTPPLESGLPSEIESMQPAALSTLYSALFYKIYLKDFKTATATLEKGLEAVEQGSPPKKGLIYEYSLELAKLYKSQGKVEKSLAALGKIERSKITLDDYLLNYRVSFFECYASSFSKKTIVSSCEEVMKLSPKEKDVSLKVQLFLNLTKEILREKKAPDPQYLDQYKNTWLVKDFF